MDGGDEIVCVGFGFVENGFDKIAGEEQACVFEVRGGRFGVGGSGRTGNAVACPGDGALEIAPRDGVELAEECELEFEPD